ncbi:N-formylglutamate deformylase [Thetidibacter halocola]|uniref:N-formylglutamate deformylase n=1 Tax=Thetidibacter halocola TaxID=2827239 RepID=A0A8J7WAN4_9RHOB|nr:N-formylglutamate deformylase [Thetidibacter halocola]MBS0124057.1 N-formylglutamate deformylase [Thetidibacter halocola]
MTPVTVTRGDGPLVLGFPHVGTHVPEAIRDRLNAEGRLLRDTDWHVDTLYDGLIPGATTVRANFHRYVIDANRDPSGASLYPGQTTTGLVPLITFDNVPIWREGMEPAPEDVAERLAAFHAPYHAALSEELARVKARHGFAILYDCHSIRSVVPWLFPGTLPDFNIGTNDGASCAPALAQAVHHVASCASAYTSVLNGRFKGGWTTRHYGRPADHVHAIQMELTQSSHLTTEAPPFALDPAKAQRLRRWLQEILEALIDLSEEMTR